MSYQILNFRVSFLLSINISVVVIIVIKRPRCAILLSNVCLTPHVRKFISMSKINDVMMMMMMMMMMTMMDVHNCSKVALGWYEGAQKVDLSDYVPSGTWDVVECPGKLENKRDPGEQHNRSQITYTLKIRRKTLFYTVNLIIPCVLISLLSVSVFYLPADPVYLPGEACECVLPAC